MYFYNANTTHVMAQILKYCQMNGLKSKKGKNYQSKNSIKS